MSEPVFVWVACISHRHGAVAFAARTEQGMRAQIAAWCRDNWRDVFETGEAPDDDQSCIDTYFAQAGNFMDADCLECNEEVELI